MLCVYGSPLYQWDINRQIQIDPSAIEGEYEVHCCHKDDSTGLVVTPTITGDVTLVKIPDVLLQRSGFLRVYVVVSGDTVYDQSFYIMARPKPDDYVYTEEELKTWEQLDEQIQEHEHRFEDIDTRIEEIVALCNDAVSTAKDVEKRADEGEFNGESYVLTEEDKSEIVADVLKELPNLDEVKF